MLHLQDKPENIKNLNPTISRENDKNVNEDKNDGDEKESKHTKSSNTRMTIDLEQIIQVFKVNIYVYIYKLDY